MKNKIASVPFMVLSLCALIGAIAYGATHQYAMFAMCFAMFLLTSEISLTKLIRKSLQQHLSIRIKIKVYNLKKA